MPSESQPAHPTAGSHESRTAHLRARAEELSHEFQAKTSQVQDQLADVDRQVRVLVREHPFMALGAAAVSGYLLGRIFSRLR